MGAFACGVINSEVWISVAQDHRTSATSYEQGLEDFGQGDGPSNGQVTHVVSTESFRELLPASKHMATRKRLLFVSSLLPITRLILPSLDKGIHRNASSSKT